MMKGEKMKKMEALRAKCREEVDAARKNLEAAEQRLAGVEMSIRTLNGEDLLSPAPRAVRPNVKQMILDLLAERGADGVNASIVVDIAAQRNERVERGTVSSLLSRFKGEGLVVYDGKLYRLSKYAVAPPIKEAPAMH